MNLECVENMLNIYENTDVHVFYYVFCVKFIKVKINVKRICNLKISRWALVEGVHFHDSRGYRINSIFVTNFKCTNDNYKIKTSKIFPKLMYFFLFD